MPATRFQSAYVSHLLVFTVAAISLGGAVGLGRVWICTQISLSANRTRGFEAELTAVERQLAETGTAIEAEQDLTKLKQRNLDLRLGLQPPRDDQVRLVRDDPVRLLASKRRRGLFEDLAAPTVVTLPRLAQLR